MTDVSTAPTLVVGLGCQKGCPVSTLLALLDQALEAVSYTHLTLPTNREV